MTTHFYTGFGGGAAETHVGPAECRSCGGTVLVSGSEYVCTENCLDCGRSRLLGWFNNEPLLVLGGGATKAFGQEVWARQIAA
jgi:hypothetical protein